MSKKIFFILSLFFTVFFLDGVTAQAKDGSTLSLDDQRKFDYYFHSGISSKVLGEYAAAYDYLNYCNRIDSTNANVLFELGNFYKSLQDKDKSFVNYKKAVLYEPSNYYYNMALASSLVENQDYKEAAEIYQRMIGLDSDKIELYMYLSEAYRLDGDFSKSIQALNDLERTMGMNENITIQKFKLYSALNDKNKAYAEVQKYIEKNPNEVRYYVLLGNLYLQDGKMKDAYAALSKGKAIDPNNPYLISSLANYYGIADDNQSAEKELSSALFNEKIDVDTKINILAQYIGILQQNKQDIHKANSILDSLMVEYPQESKFNLLYGNLLLMEENKKDANFQFKIYAESNPTDPSGWEQLLQSTDVDSINEMIDVCKSAIEYLPEQPLFYFYQSIGEFQQKDYGQALKTANAGLVYAEENPKLLSEFYSQIGNLHYELNEKDSAFVNFKKALLYNPQNLPVLNNYSYYLSLTRENLDEAERMSSITVKAEPTNPTYLDTYGWILFEQGAFTLAKVYLENALKYSKNTNGEDVSAEVLEHYGDVLFMTDEKDKALEYWQKAKEKGSESKTLDEKIKTKTYISTTENKK